MRNWLFDELTCPACAGALQVVLDLTPGGDHLDYGVIRCTGCGEEYPVAEGIPILQSAQTRLDLKSETTDDVVVRGAALGDVTSAIRRNDPVTALSLLLNPAKLDHPAWTFDPAVTGSRRTSSGSAAPSRSPVEPSPPATPSLFRRALRAPYRRLRRMFRAYMLPTWRRRLAAHLRVNRTRMSAVELFDLYFRRYAGVDGMTCNWPDWVVPSA